MNMTVNLTELKLTAENHTVSINDMAVDPRLQMRTCMDQDAIAQYAEKIDSILEKHPIMVVSVTYPTGREVWYIVDGFHRYHAARAAERETLNIMLMRGSWEDAVQYAMTANWANGMRPSKEAAKRSIEMLLETAPDFGYDSKKVIPWLAGYGIPKSTARNNTKKMREEIDELRDAKIEDLFTEGSSLREIASVVGASPQTVKNILDAVQNKPEAQTGQDDEEHPQPPSTPDASTSWDADDSPFFDEEELDDTPAVNPADAFNNAVKQHEHERSVQKQSEACTGVDRLSSGLYQFASLLQDASPADIAALLKSDKDQDVSSIRLLTDMLLAGRVESINFTSIQTRSPSNDPLHRTTCPLTKSA